MACRPLPVGKDEQDLGQKTRGGRSPRGWVEGFSPSNDERVPVPPVPRAQSSFSLKDTSFLHQTPHFSTRHLISLPETTFIEKTPHLSRKHQFSRTGWPIALRLCVPPQSSTLKKKVAATRVKSEQIFPEKNENVPLSLIPQRGDYGIPDISLISPGYTPEIPQIYP